MQATQFVGPKSKEPNFYCHLRRATTTTTKPSKKQSKISPLTVGTPDEVSSPIPSLPSNPPSTQQTSQQLDLHQPPIDRDRTQQQPTDSDIATQFPTAVTTLDLTSLPAFRDLAEMVTNLQVKISDLEQEILNQKCLHKSHTKVLQAQIFDLETNNKTLSDKIASLANYPQNRQDGCNRNQKGRSKPLNSSTAPKVSQQMVYLTLHPHFPLILKITSQAQAIMSPFHPAIHTNPPHIKTHPQIQSPTSVLYGELKIL